jgi:hypothetical protein
MQSLKKQLQFKYHSSNEWHVISININHASMQKKILLVWKKSAVKWNIVQAKGRQSLSDYLRKISSVLVEYKVS